ncbi:MAG: methionyl-tRNA formyltransferase [Candidatus Kaiserbacteria bacterium]|nr:methionyl-tRNA formyltransferase [Candidatus Kaiserbacteria bacterium]MCB9816148.1 methionyl-tRNA formyltransferase [Candidatus Nomurabacteria bacterium]
MNKEIKFAYFGGEPLGVPALEELAAAGLMPSLVVCNPDRPAGRGHKLTPPPVKIWAEAHNIPVFQPDSYKAEVTRQRLESESWDAFVVVAYNFILPEWLLEMPKHGVLNAHPSLLPKLRGASPIRTAILKDLRDEVGVTVMLLDKEMDHGPILDQMAMDISDENWPVSGPDLDLALARMGGSLLADVLPAWITGELAPQEQDHGAATYCGRFKKGENELTIDPLDLPTGQAALAAWHTINAWAGIGDTYFMHNDKRVKVKMAELTNNGTLQLLRVTPEGKREIDFDDYLKSVS